MYTKQIFSLKQNFRSELIICPALTRQIKQCTLHYHCCIMNLLNYCLIVLLLK